MPRMRIKLWTDDKKKREKEADTLFDIGNPDIDWAHLAKGMGMEGYRAETAEDFAKKLEAALAADGPQLIDAVYSG